MTESYSEERDILGHFHVMMQMVSSTLMNKNGNTVSATARDPEYACLRSMMLEPQNPTMWNALALVYIMTNNYQEASDAIERSLDLDTSVAWTWTIWGDLLGLLGEDIESERAYRMAVELGSREPHVLNRLARLCSSRRCYSEALSLLEDLIPLKPEDQSLWDLYSECLSHRTLLTHD
ncbi:MAG: hypothetical protein JW779_13170 [Candidatus Thorarchaeota archaeon]|nr:hypothetical protein [Candidatus Thorarchaeota archaeon]